MAVYGRCGVSVLLMALLTTSSSFANSPKIPRATRQSDPLTFNLRIIGQFPQSHQLVAKHYDAVRDLVARRASRSMDPADVREIVHDVLIETTRRFLGGTKELGFIQMAHVIARSRLTDYSRRSGRRRDQFISFGELSRENVSGENLVEARPGADPAARMRNAERRLAVHHALEQLSPLQRQMLIARYIKEQSNREIARANHIPVGTVQSRLGEGKRQLKRLLHRDPAARPGD